MSWKVRKEYATVLALSVVAEIGVRVVPLHQLAKVFRVRLFEQVDETRSVPLVALPEWAKQRLRVVGSVMRKWPVDGACLRKSLVAGHRIRSMDPALKVGVMRRDGSVAAHAWLEVQGRSLDETSALYDELPSAGS
jgi:hypothetical protein